MSPDPCALFADGGSDALEELIKGLWPIWFPFALVGYLLYLMLTDPDAARVMGWFSPHKPIEQPSEPAKPFLTAGCWQICGTLLLMLVVSYLFSRLAMRALRWWLD